MSTFNSTGAVSQSITRIGRNEPFDLQVGRGQITYHNGVAIFGYSGSIGNTTTPQTIWEGANNATQNNYTYLVAASKLTLVSTSASDTGILFVAGLDASFNYLSEYITLTGTTPALTVNTYFRVNSLYYTNGSNVGTITAKVSTTTYGQINPGIGQTQMGVYSVPLGYTFYQTYLQANSTLANQAVLFQTQSIYNLAATLPLNGYNVNVAANTANLGFSPFSTGFFNIPFTVPIMFPQGTDIQWQAKTNSGGINGAVSVFAGGYLIKNDGSL
jgi:hypothetical protein